MTTVDGADAWAAACWPSPVTTLRSRPMSAAWLVVPSIAIRCACRSPKADRHPRRAMTYRRTTGLLPPRSAGPYCIRSDVLCLAQRRAVDRRSVMGTAPRHLVLASRALGWGYFLAWSLSFYQQVVVNYRLRRTPLTGLSPHFLAYNFTGFLFYAIFVTATYAVQKRDGAAVSVDPNDIAFAVHALVITAVTMAQYVAYGGARALSYRPAPPLAWLHTYVLAALWTLAGLCVALAATRLIPWIASDSPSYRFSVVTYLGSAKIFITTLKYVPQAVHNASRRSTQALDAVIQGTADVFTGNVPKLLLALLSISFDIVFIVQHYVLYRGLPGDEHAPLLHTRPSGDLPVAI
ncbi:unnamed protein product (mitochondrion) [Plasmodiophora brassicae]|uniref:Cystinosin n=1 Tax=Plasmodiophora brassicae TaxID=37360 RepID=A0A3P3YA57_PLABS|nr:unnamed protein product [Plasmodiophora brassicae]